MIVEVGSLTFYNNKPTMFKSAYFCKKVERLLLGALNVKSVNLSKVENVNFC
jgi:hypothetical protein